MLDWNRLLLRVRVIAGIFALVIGAASSGCRDNDATAVDSSGPRPISAVYEGGKAFRWEAVKGARVLVHFWATWCPPCVKEFPEVVALARKLEDKGVKVLAISLDRSWEDAHSILNKAAPLPKNFLSVLDPTLKTGEAWGSFQFPETYLVNADGTIAEKWVGPQNWGSPELFAKILPAR